MESHSRLPQRSGGCLLGREETYVRQAEADPGNIQEESCKRTGRVGGWARSVDGRVVEVEVRVGAGWGRGGVRV